MLAISEKETTQLVSAIPARASMISHDPVNRVITLEVMVAQPLGVGAVTIYAPPITISSGTWTVNWDFVLPTEGLVARIVSCGIAMLAAPTLPPKVTIVAWPSAASLLRWTMQIQNEVTKVNAFNYNVSITLRVGPDGPTKVTAVHDPTIAVVKDPVEPPPAP